MDALNSRGPHTGRRRRVEGLRTRIVPVAVVDVPVEFLEDGHLHLGGDAGVVLFIWFKNIFIEGIIRGGEALTWQTNNIK
jgi:hypothetical protein